MPTNDVPQFAQNFALAGFAKPQFGQFMDYAYCNEPRDDVYGAIIDS